MVPQLYNNKSIGIKEKRASFLGNVFATEDGWVSQKTS